METVAEKLFPHPSFASVLSPRLLLRSMEEKTICPGCNETFSRLGHHWAFNDDCRPELTQTQKEISTGLIMGDGWLEKTENNARLATYMITKPYLEYIDEVFGCLSTGVKLKYTAEDSAKHSEKVGALGNSGNPSKFSELYRWQTRVHPYFNNYREWYQDNGKRFPEDIELTPTVLKHWYVCDGCFQLSGGTTPYATLGMSNETGNEAKIENYFESVGLKINSFNKSKREDGSEMMAAIFNKNETMDLFDYIGNSLPGFEYKFPKRFGGNVEVEI